MLNLYILNESLNQFKLDLKNTLSTMLNDLFKYPRHLVQQSVERTLKQMLKPFKRAFTPAQIYVGGNFDVLFLLCSGVKALEHEQTCFDELFFKNLAHVLSEKLS